MDLLTNNNEGLSAEGQQAFTEEEIFRSMKINQESKTPYSDATQVGNLRIVCDNDLQYFDKGLLHRGPLQF